nr:hypothetical protein [Tanacetum cinerariifolium]
CQPDNQNVDFSGSDQIQTSQYPDINPPSPGITNKENFQAKGDFMKSIQTFLERFNCIPFEVKPQILFKTWETFFAIQCSQPEDSNELFQKLLKDLKKLTEYDQSTSTDRLIFLNGDEGHSVQDKESLENPFNEIAVSKPDNESDLEPEATTDAELSSTKDIHPLAVQEPPHDSNIYQLIREECFEEVPEEQKQNMEKTMLELIEICRHKQILSPILSTKEPEHLLSMGYEHLIITLETESDEVTESNAENLLPIPSKCEVTLEDKRECDLPISENSPVCDNHSDIFLDSKIDDDISVYEDDFKDTEYIEASLSDPEIANIVLREKLLSITCLISNIESLNDNPTPDRVLNSFASDNSLLDSFLPEFETFRDHSEETRSGNTTHANYSLAKYDLFCFKIKPGQERLINLMKNDNSDSSNDPLFEEVDLFLFDNSIPTSIENFDDDPEGDIQIDLFLAFDNSIPPGIENFGYYSEGDIRFLEELLIDDSIPLPNNESSDFEDDPLFPRPPPEPPDVEFFFDLEPDVIAEEILDELNEDECFDPGGEIDVFANIKDDDYFPFIFVIRIFLSY